MRIEELRMVIGQASRHQGIEASRVDPGSREAVKVGGALADLLQDAKLETRLGRDSVVALEGYIMAVPERYRVKVRDGLVGLMLLPVSVRAVAQAVDLPEATLRKHATIFEAVRERAKRVVEARGGSLGVLEVRT